jgi:hypothetical protein
MGLRLFTFRPQRGAAISAHTKYEVGAKTVVEPEPAPCGAILRSVSALSPPRLRDRLQPCPEGENLADDRSRLVQSSRGMAEGCARGDEEESGGYGHEDPR